MDKKRTIAIVLLLALSVGAAGTTGFFIGKNGTENRYIIEQDLNVKLNRSDLDGLGKIEGAIYVTGHKSPDSDTVGSSIAYAALLKQLGYDARAVVLEEINNESKYILETAKLDVPQTLEDASGLNMILVDHSEYTQSAEGLENANIISIIDHHNDGAVTTGNQIIYDARPLGSTATIIWIRYRNYGLVPDKQTATVMLGAILSDTVNLTSDATTFADKEAVKALSAIAGIKDTDAFYQQMFKERLSYKGMTEEEIFFSDYKEYETDGHKYSIGIIEVYDEDAIKKMADRIKTVVPSTLKSTGMEMAFAQINVYHDDISITYIVPSDEAAGEVIKSAFGDKAVFDGTSYVFNPGMSRKKVLVPAITEVLKAHPKE